MTDATQDEDLAGLVQLADAYGLEYDLVLTLPGLVVAGTLVSGVVFARETADVVQGQDPEETLRGGLARRFRQRADELHDFGAASTLGDLDPESAENEDLPTMPEVQYVHLRDVTVAGTTLPLWRGRLADVVGWSLVAPRG